MILFGCLTIAPSIFNVYDFYTPGAIVHPWLSESYNQIVPNWWMTCYPITYYFIGAFLRTHINIKKMNTEKLVVFFILSVLGCGTYNIWRSYSQNFQWGSWCDWGSYQNTLNTVLLFLMVNSIEYNKELGEKTKKIIRRISEFSFGAYILSYITDSISYPILIGHEENIYTRMYYFPIIVAVSICGSLSLSWLVQIIREQGKKGYSKLLLAVERYRKI